MIISKWYDRSGLVSPEWRQISECTDLLARLKDSVVSDLIRVQPCVGRLSYSAAEEYRFLCKFHKDKRTGYEPFLRENFLAEGMTSFFVLQLTSGLSVGFAEGAEWNTLYLHEFGANGFSPPADEKNRYDPYLGYEKFRLCQPCDPAVSR